MFRAIPGSCRRYSHHAGIEFLHLGCNAASSSPRVRLLFMWEGPDGSRVLTMYAAEGYGTGLVPPENWPYRTWLALIHTGDNHGPPKPEEVSQLLAEAKQKLPGVKVRIGRLSDFSDAIKSEQATIPVVRGDMPDSWIHGPLCNPQGAQLARTERPRIAAAESLHTLLSLWGVPTDDARGAIAAAYEKSLLYGEHTWGGALAWVSAYDRPGAMSYGEDWKKLREAGKYTRLEASWAEHTAYIEAARDSDRTGAREGTRRHSPAPSRSRDSAWWCSIRWPGSATAWSPSRGPARNRRPCSAWMTARLSRVQADGDRFSSSRAACPAWAIARTSHRRKHRRRHPPPAMQTTHTLISPHFTRRTGSGHRFSPLPDRRSRTSVG